MINYSKRKKNFLILLLINLVVFVNIILAQATNKTIIYLDSTDQVIQGFGAANILPWRPDMKPDEIIKAFGTDDGQLGFTILRLRLPSDPNEFARNVQTAKAAHSMGVKIIASPWSPPAYMKSNKNIVGGRLLDEYYDDYALHLKSFVDFMASNGVPIYAVSVQNEPDIKVNYESCDWTAAEMVKFIRENAPTVGTRIIAPESYQFIKTISDAILNDPIAVKNVDIIGGHIYGGGLEPYPLAKSKGKELWMTEHLETDTTWQKVLETGKEIHDCMIAGMNAYIWWYIVRFYGPILENSQVSKRGYIMSQFSRFIRPGFVRVYNSNAKYIDNRKGIEIYTSAYKSNDKIIIVVVNMGISIEQTFVLDSKTANKFTPYITTKTKNCERGNDINVVNNSFTFTIEGESVTTFVSDGIFTSVEEDLLPEEFNLSQNYPNPFNPSTIINYQLPERNFVTIKVYDVLGKEITTLVNEFKEAGNYKIEFSADKYNLSSGIYFYTLKAGTNFAVKKMIYVK
ncbi:T9SS type A sorting domain-containing protein [Rosettibacter firmus]|uniref:T9SS type A sorting domain-containing protein n=1 Tax=Rosettibacter firmus TaxID=3111522 RepID=UPI00336BB7A3